ncbi:MAG: glycosyltransferase family 4 protein, partial [Chloroflexota bacterium]
MTTYEVIPNFMTNQVGLFEDYKAERPLRIAMLIQTYHPALGGAGKQLSILAPLLKRQGIDLHIITLRQPGMNRFEIVKGVPVHRLAIPMSDVMKSMSFSLNAMPLLRQLQPDLVHSHALLSPTTTAVMAKRLNGTPVVAKVLRSGILGDISKLRRKPFGARRMAAFKTYVDAFIAESQEINRELRDAGIPTDKRIFIPNGVDTSRFKPVGPLVKRAIRTNLKLPEGPLVIFTGRLTMDKRLDQLIYVWNDVRKKYHNANLLIVGGGEQESRLRSLAGDGVIFTGHVGEVTPYLNAADLFILPSATGG